MPRIKPVNAHRVQTTVYGVDPWGAALGFAVAEVAQRANAGTNVPTTTNPVNRFNGDADAVVQSFLGEAGQLGAELGAGTPDNNPVVGFHSTDSSPLLDDPVSAALLDQLSRTGAM